MVLQRMPWEMHKSCRVDGLNKFKSVIDVKNFGGFRILSGDLLKKLMNR